MKKRTVVIVLVSFLLVLCIGLPVLAGDDATPGDIVFNEFLADPGAVDDSNGEWVEIHNTTGIAINIDGWTFRDAAGVHVIDNGGSLSIAANGKLVLCKNSNIASNGGVTCDYQYATVTLNNSAETLSLIEDAGAIQTIATITYGTTQAKTKKSAYYIPTTKPPASGYFTDNQDMSRWGVTDDVDSNRYGGVAGDFGTPGAANTQTGETGAPTAITLRGLSASAGGTTLPVMGLALAGLLVGAVVVRRK